MLLIGNHIISSENFRAPKDYRDVFTVLEDNHVVPNELGIRLRQMAGLRNRLVHLYWEIDNEMIDEYIKANLGDFERYIHEILIFINTLP